MSTPKGKILVGDARRIAENRRCPMLVIFGLEEGADTFSVVSYGMNRRLCRLAASLADQIAARVLNGDIGPPEVEPAELPDQPAAYQGQRRKPGGPQP